jgi:hypothetical protein
MEIKEGAEMFRGLHAPELLNFQVQKYSECSRGSRNGNYGGNGLILALGATNLAVQFGLRFPCRGTKLNRGDGHASQFEESLADRPLEVKSYSLSQMYILLLNRYIGQNFVCHSFTPTGSSN